ncbi:MAG: D-alanyl-D-alanine carboxypeptidase family protein [Candidatus Altimarinota bacterium]
MWDKITSFILSNLIPASVMGSQTISPVALPPPLAIQVEPLAIVVDQEIPAPQVGAKAVLVIETHSNEALYSQNVWETFPIASLTKLMTALIVKEKANLDQVVTVGPIIHKVAGSKMGLKEGEQITIHNLLKGLLITSGNDAAMVLSEAVAGSSEAFVEMMNQRKHGLGLESTQFVDPAGIQNGNVSSAFEIAHLAKHVFKDSLLQSIMREKEAIVTSADGKYTHVLSNTNRLLGTDIGERIIAGKTGTTPLAGQCLISFIGNEADRTTMTVILGSNNRYEEMKKLIEWVDKTFIWQ